MRKIKDTDIVYSAVAIDGTLRFALEPVLDSEPSPDGPHEQAAMKFPCRVVWELCGAYATSCRSVDATVEDLNEARYEWGAEYLPHDTNDGWLDWLAGGDLPND
jgi:hypothetical protein